MCHGLRFQVVVLWVVTPCNEVVGNQRLGGSCCLNHFTLKTEARKSSETLVCYITTRRHNTQERDLNLHRHENHQISQKRSFIIREISSQDKSCPRALSYLSLS
jgi:hypothetical protein